MITKVLKFILHTILGINGIFILIDSIALVNDFNEFIAKFSLGLFLISYGVDHD